MGGERKNRVNTERHELVENRKGTRKVRQGTVTLDYQEKEKKNWKKTRHRR